MDVRALERSAAASVGIAPIRWGLLGTARVTRHVFAAAQSGQTMDIVAVASRDGARADAFARENQLERAHAGYERLLEDDDVEAVYISLPNALHLEWTLRALEAGKHVLCEKPLGRDPLAVSEAFGAADRAQLVLMEGLMHRHHPQMRLAAELLAQGAIGEPQLIRSTFSFPLSDAHDIRLSSELDGGALMDLGCYPVSCARALTGEPEAVEGAAIRSPGGVDVRFYGTMYMAGDVVTRFEVAFTLPRRQQLEVLGSEGVIVFSSPFACREPTIERHHDGTVEMIEVPAANPYLLEFDAMAAAIRSRSTPALSRADAVAQARVLGALHDAADRSPPRSPVATALDPASEPRRLG